MIFEDYIMIPALVGVHGIGEKGMVGAVRWCREDSCSFWYGIHPTLCLPWLSVSISAVSVKTANLRTGNLSDDDLPNPSEMMFVSQTYSQSTRMAL